MKYFLDHDWQGNMQTPKKKVGEKAKINFLIIFATIYLVFGLFTHSPWRPLETNSFSIFANIFFNGDILAPHLASINSFDHGHIYEILGAIFAKIIFFLEPHNAARLANILWLALTMISIGLTNRELRGIGYGRQSNIIFLSSVGLFFTLHTFTHEIAILTAASLCLYSFSLSHRRPFRASILLGISIIIGLLSKGLMYLIPIIGITATLAILPNWNYRRTIIFAGLGLLSSLIFIGVWIFLLSLYHPNSLEKFLFPMISFSTENIKYYFVNLLWFAWPALPLFMVTLFNEFSTFLKYKRTNLPLVFLAWFFLLLICESQISQVKLVILLPAIAIMASSSIDSLQRGASGALNWFGILIFSAITLILWIGWFALNFGIPYKIHERMVYLSGNLTPELNFFHIFLALFFLIVWITSLWKNNLTNRSSVTNWALGITLAWVTTTLLWFPMIENRKDYGRIFKQINAINIPYNQCMIANDLNNSFVDLIFYCTQIDIRKNDKNCKYIISHKDIRSISSDPEFKSRILWQGKMPNDKKTFYIMKN